MGGLTWAFFIYQYTNINSTFAIYYANATEGYGYNVTESVTNNDWWNDPRSWDMTFDAVFEEGFAKSTNYIKLDDTFIDVDGIYNVLNIGWDEFAYPGNVPPPAACDEPSGGISYINNEGSVGKSRGISIPLSNIKGIRDFQFNYCNTRFW